MTAGCESCRLWGVEVSHPLGQSARRQASIHRCDRCGTYWENPGFTYPGILTEAQALEALAEPQPLTVTDIVAGIDPVLRAALCAAEVGRGFATITDSSGAVRWTLRQNLGLFDVATPEVGRVAWGMPAEVAQVYLSTQVGDAARRALDLPPIVVPSQRDALASGFVVSTNEDGHRLSRDGRPLATFASARGPVELSHHLAHGVDSVIARYLFG